MIILGIDPGKTGGLAIVDAHPGWQPILAKAARMPTVGAKNEVTVDARVIHDFMSWWPEVAVIERVHAMPSQGVSSTFRFGAMYGSINALIHETGLKTLYVTPKQWKGHFGITSKEESLELAKQKLSSTRTDIEKLFSVKANDGIAEAALMALWYYETQHVGAE